MAREIKLSDGTTATVGDFIGFKADTETYGKITKIDAYGNIDVFAEDDCGMDCYYTTDSAHAWKE